LSGLDFQLELAKANIHIPIVFMIGHGDIRRSVMAMKAGAVDFLSKPFRQQEMLDAVPVAIERDRKRRKDEKIVSNAQALFETLPPREREVLSLVAAGLPPGWRRHAVDPSVWIGLRQLAVQSPQCDETATSGSR
jgi:FixJ family two-component response regulator